jgi:hypothetical protein
MNHRAPEQSNLTKPMVARTPLLALLAAGCLLLAAPADAQRRAPDGTIAGDYEVKFEQVANNCTDIGMNLSRGTITVTERANRRVDLQIPLVPGLTGTTSGGGKFKAQAPRGRTGIQGVDGQFSAAGRVDDGLIQMVFIAEYYKGKKPLCTQSWNVSGLHKNRLRKGSLSDP